MVAAHQARPWQFVLVCQTSYGCSQVKQLPVLLKVRDRCAEACSPDLVSCCEPLQTSCLAEISIKSGLVPVSMRPFTMVNGLEGQLFELTGRHCYKTYEL